MCTRLNAGIEICTRHIFRPRLTHRLPCLQAYLAGLTFALAASPCSTPVLATLLAYVASKGDLVQGGSLLLSYTSGYVTDPTIMMPPASPQTSAL